MNVLPLSNRFEPLQYSSVTEQTESRSEDDDNTQLSNAFPSSCDSLEYEAKSFHRGKKPCRSLFDSLLQQKLATQANFTTLEGNKNEIGSFAEGDNSRTVRVGFHTQTAAQGTSTSLDSHKTIQETGVSTKLKPQYSSPIADAEQTSSNDLMPSETTKFFLVNSHHPDFCFLPNSPLHTHTGDPVYYETILDLIKAHQLIRNSGLANFLKCRIPVQSGLNINAWRSHLHYYNFDRSRHLLSTEINHTSALRFSESIQEYFCTYISVFHLLDYLPIVYYKLFEVPLE